MQRLQALQTLQKGLKVFLLFSIVSELSVYLVKFIRMNIPTIAEQELLHKLDFPIKEVLKSPEQIEDRKNIAQRAKKLGSLSNERVKIVFEDIEGKKMVETTIWGVTGKYLMLKKGMTLPLHRVHEIIINEKAVNR